MKIFVKAKTGAKSEIIKEVDRTHFTVAVKERPTDGKANRAIEKALARHLGISSSRVRIVSGGTSRQKIVEVD